MSEKRTKVRRPLPGRSFAEVFPELANEAHEWDPSTVSAKSNVKQRWKCSREHLFESDPAHRARGDGCPVCSNKKVLPGFNDIATTHPLLALEADGWDATKYSFGAGGRLTWKCKFGHTWKCSPNSRTSNDSGCPTCSGKLTLPGYNDLLLVNPQLAAQAYGWDPSRVAPVSAKIYEWRCELGHIWRSSVTNRSRGDGCPVCSNKKILPGFNDLQTLFPDVAAQAHGWDPTMYSISSSKSMEWKCEFGHIWKVTISGRTPPKSSGCPFCTGRFAITGETDLATTNPELAAQADGWNPTTLTAGSGLKVGWICGQGHHWIATVAHRSGGTTCPVCSGHKVQAGVNDLATTNPELAAQADGWNPTTLTAGSHAKVNWICEQGHEWNATVADRSSDSGCPVCSGHKVLAGVNDLATTNPELAVQAIGWDPTTLTAWSNTKVGWKCKQSHNWNATVADRSSGKGCPVCSGRTVQVGVSDLATTNPELAAQADGWDPTTLASYSNKMVGWKCELGHKWNAVLASRTTGNGCPVCSGRTALSGFNDLATTNPELAAQADGWDPTTLTAGSGLKVGWICGQGHRWISSIAKRSSGRGCPSCAQTGFDPNMDGWLYLIDNDALSLFQIGISNFPENRLGQHSKRGWEVMEVRGPMNGHLARQLETAILHAVERRGAVLGHKAEIEKFDGYSEAWTKDSLTVTSFKQLLDWVYEDDQNTHLTR